MKFTQIEHKDNGIEGVWLRSNDENRSSFSFFKNANGFNICFYKRTTESVNPGQVPDLGLLIKPNGTIELQATKAERGGNNQTFTGELFAILNTKPAEFGYEKFANDLLETVRKDTAFKDIDAAFKKSTDEKLHLAKRVEELEKKLAIVEKKQAEPIRYPEETKTPTAPKV